MRHRSEQEPAGRTRAASDGPGGGAVARSLSGTSAALTEVRVVVAGEVVRVTPLRAARLLETREAELPEDVSLAEGVAILQAGEVREGISVRTLRLEMSNRGADMPDRFGGRISEPGSLSGWR
jgi:hypothetical protein